MRGRLNKLDFASPGGLKDVRRGVEQHSSRRHGACKRAVDPVERAGLELFVGFRSAMARAAAG
jgi:hypothetical protein